MRQYRPRWAIENNIDVGPSCPDKTSCFRTEELATENARSEEIRRGIPEFSFRAWHHSRGCGWWHVSKTGAYKAFIKGHLFGTQSSYLQERNPADEAELGVRVLGCGDRENKGTEQQRIKDFRRFRRVIPREDW